MKVFLLRWLSSTVAFIVTVKLLPGIWVTNWHAYWLGALVLGLLNAFVRPVLLFLTLPLNILTLGLFTILLNAAIFFSLGYIIPPIMIKNYTWAILGSLLFSAFSTLLSWLFQERPEIKARFHLWRY
ncbi:MAG: phage holin family protein [Elusimicrobiota bacterium]|jgi:putative membrane protein